MGEGRTTSGIRITRRGGVARSITTVSRGVPHPVRYNGKMEIVKSEEIKRRAKDVHWQRKVGQQEFYMYYASLDREVAADIYRRFDREVPPGLRGSRKFKLDFENKEIDLELSRAVDKINILVSKGGKNIYSLRAEMKESSPIGRLPGHQLAVYFYGDNRGVGEKGVKVLNWILGNMINDRRLLIEDFERRK